MPARVLTGPERAATDGPAHTNASAIAAAVVIRLMGLLRIFSGP
jgi:hypothetical protein